VPGAIQVKLLRVLQEREFERLGSNVVAAHRRARDCRHQPGPAGGARAGHLPRGPVYYRLNVVPINIPPLRERKQDIPFLAAHL